MHDGKSERNRSSRNSRDRLSAWLGAWESSPEISRWRHLKFRYAFARSMSFFLGRGAAPSHPAHSYIFIYRYHIRRLSVCVIISANWTVSFECELLSVSSVCFWVFRCRLCLPNSTDINFTLVGHTPTFCYNDLYTAISAASVPNY